MGFTKEWIESIPKIIDENGCWIPSKIRPRSDGYINIMAERVSYYLHRIVLCTYYNIKYDDYSIETRHSKGCNRACFNPAHLKPGTGIDNMKDMVEHHIDEKCPKCGGKYSIKKTLRNLAIIRITRICKPCHSLYKIKRRLSKVSQ